MANKTEIIIIRESPRESFIMDLTSSATLVLVVLIGVALHSDALQWIGGGIAVMWLFSLGSTRHKKMTIAQARKRLDDLENDKEEWE